MKVCFYCEKNNEKIADDFIGDFDCDFCKVQNSVYDKNDYKPLTEEVEMSMDLKSWSKENAKFIKINDGESYEGVYQGYKEGVNMNNDPAIIYKLDGKEFKSSSAAMAEKFADIPEGTKVKISREGEGFQTRWKVEKI